VLGYDTTLPVTLDMMVHHTRAVCRGVERALVVADLPFLTYQVSIEDAMRNAGRLMQEGGARSEAEGGSRVVDVVRRLNESGIPVMGHLD
jgi:3-methyl-2-oxobutanoate hydroxymethyltransferase